MAPVLWLLIFSALSERFREGKLDLHVLLHEDRLVSAVGAGGKQFCFCLGFWFRILWDGSGARNQEMIRFHGDD